MESVGRIFIAVPLDDETRAALAVELKSTVSRIPGRPVPPANWHITLRFLGDLDVVSYEKVVASLDEAVATLPFELRFGQLGAFPNPRRATVLWRALEGELDSLRDVEAEVSEGLERVGIGLDDRPFHPHLTLARIRPDEDVRSLVVKELPESIAFEVGRIVVFRSELGSGPARYEELEEIVLG